MIIICLGKGLFEFILFGTLCASCTWISVFFLRFGEFSAKIFFKYIFSFLLSFFSFWDPYYMKIGMLYIIPYLLDCFHFFICLSSAVLIGWLTLFYLPCHLFIPLHYSFCYSLPLAQSSYWQINLLFFYWLLFLVYSSFL